MRTDARQNNRNGFMKMMRFGRTLLTGFPLTDASMMLVLYDVALSLVSLLTSKLYVGSICAFELTPGSLLHESPLLAKVDANNYSFPSRPIKVKNITIRITNTTAFGQRLGKWAAVYVPYREEHDAEKYSGELKTLSYSQICQMPYARSGNCSQDLVLSFRNRNIADYCSRARELSEAIGALVVVWENYDRNEADYKTAFTNTDFSCEFELSGVVEPLVVYGPNHRTSFAKEVFQPKKITVSGKQLYLLADGDAFYGTESEAVSYQMDKMSIP